MKLKNRNKYNFINETTNLNSSKKSPFGPLGQIVDIRTYRRWLPDKKRRETLEERNARVINYNLNLVLDRVPLPKLQEEADIMFESLNNLKTWPSGRTAWVGGTPTSDKLPSSNFNCSFTAINRLDSFSDVFELLMVGTGVGFRVHTQDIEKLPERFQSVPVNFADPITIEKKDRQENTTLSWDFETLYVTVGDSRQGWIDAIRALFAVSFNDFSQISHLTSTNNLSLVERVEFNLNHIRSKGERIQGFGGTASGPSALKNMILDVHRILDECPTSKLRSIDAMDICCAIAKGVVAGSSRRSALISLFEEGDTLCANAKKGLYTDPALRHKSYRSQSNNTENLASSKLSDIKNFALNHPNLELSHPEVRKFILSTRPTLEDLEDKFKSVKTEGEPGFDNWARMCLARFYAARKWRPELSPEEIWQEFCDLGTNPCFSGDTLILTREGHFPIKDLVGKTVEVWDGMSWVSIDNFRVTGTHQEVYEIELHSGQTIKATSNHTFILSDGTKKKLFELEEGDELLSHEISVHGSKKEPGAYLKGFLLGDGTHSSGRPILHLYDSKFGCASRLAISCLEIDTEEVNTNAVAEPAFKEPVGNKSFMNGLSVRKDELLPWVTTQRESLSYDILNWDYESKLEFLAGLFDADGSASDNSNGFMYQLTSIHKPTLLMVQLLLQSIGVYSTLRLKNDSSRVDGTYDFGENRGGICNVQPAYRLTISQADSITFSQQVNFTRLLDFSSKTVVRSFRNKKFKIRSIKPHSIQELVYCCTVPTNNQVSLSCNTVTGQCHEIILSAGTSSLNAEGVSFCNLTSTPLPNHIVKKENSYLLNRESLKSAIELSVRIGLRQTCVDMPKPHMNITQLEERLLGVSITGCQDAFDLLGWKTGDMEISSLLREIKTWANEEATRYAKELGVPRPLLVTTIKPEGSQKLDHIRVSSEGLLNLNEIIELAGETKESLLYKEEFTPITLGDNCAGESIKALYFNGPTKACKVTLNNGREIVGTPQHPLSVSNTWVPMYLIKPGMILDIELGKYNKLQNASLSILNLEKTPSTHVIRQPSELTPNLAWLIGALLANANFNGSGHIRHHCEHLEVVQEVSDLVEFIFGIQGKIRKHDTKNMYLYDVHSTQLVSWFREKGFHKDGWSTVPRLIRESSFESILSFITGYLDNDGCFKNEGCTLTTTNISFAEQLQEVAEAVGLSFSLYRTTRETTKGECTYVDLQLSRCFSTDSAIDYVNSNSLKVEIFNRPIIKTDRLRKNPYQVKSVEILEEEVETGDIEVNNTHWYYQGAIKSHNTFSQIVGTGSGLHWDWAPYYIRRVRMSGADALAKTLIEQGFEASPELYDLEEYTAALYSQNLYEGFKNWQDSISYTPWQRLKFMFGVPKPRYGLKDYWRTLNPWQKLDYFNSLRDTKKREFLDNCDTVVFSFPVKSNSSRAGNEIPALEQLENLKAFTLHYCDHMPSCTITVKDHEWDSVISWVWNNWDVFMTGSFLPYFGGNYPLLPNEEIDAETYQKLLDKIPTVYKSETANGRISFLVDERILEQYEIMLEDPDDVDVESSCSTGLCPAR